MELDFDQYKEQQFCDNDKCAFFGEVGLGNIKIKSRPKNQVYCNRCKNTWVFTKGTFFFNLKTHPKDVLESLLLLSEGIGVRATHRVKGFTTDILRDWIIKAAAHANEISAYFKQDMKLTQCQIDEFWSFILKKKSAYQKMTKNRKS